MEGEEKIIVWVMDRARGEERGNFKIGMAPPRFHKGLREKGKTGDGPYPNHLGRDWDKRRMGERRENDRQREGGERRVGPNGPEGNSKGNKYKEREGIYLNVCILRLEHVREGSPHFPTAQSDVFELVLLSNQQFKIQKLFIFYHKWQIKQQTITSDKLGSVDVWHFGLKNDDACN